MARRPPATWLCPCGEGPATTLALLWIWRTSAELPHAQRDRWVVYDCELWCADCAAADRRSGYHRQDGMQYLTVKLSCQTKQELVAQILAQIVGATRGYVPKTDLRKALKALTRQGGPVRSTRPTTDDDDEDLRSLWWEEQWEHFFPSDQDDQDDQDDDR